MTTTEYLEIQGVKYPVIINWNVIAALQFETGLNFFDQLAELKHKLYLVQPLLYNAIKEGQLVNRVPVTITMEEAHLLLSDNEVYDSTLDLLPKFFPANNGEVTTTGKKK